MRKAVILAVCLTVAAAAGCSQTREERNRERLAVAPKLVIGDIPVPERFKIVDSRSYFSVNPNARTRVVFVTYRGNARLEGLLEFYRENMSISGWEMQKESGDFGTYVLEFRKENESAEVRITPGRFSAEVAISVNPSSGGG